MMTMTTTANSTASIIIFDSTDLLGTVNIHKNYITWIRNA